MTPENFAYWLQGFFEITTAGGAAPALNAEQTEIVRRHLNMVFLHAIDPSLGPEEHLEKLRDAHEDNSDAAKEKAVEDKARKFWSERTDFPTRFPNTRIMC